MDSYTYATYNYNKRTYTREGSIYLAFTTTGTTEFPLTWIVPNGNGGASYFWNPNQKSIDDIKNELNDKIEDLQKEINVCKNSLKDLDNFNCKLAKKENDNYLNEILKLITAKKI